MSQLYKRAWSAAGLTLSLLATGAIAQTTDPNGRIAYAAWDDSGFHDIFRVDPTDPSAPPVKLTTDGEYNNHPDWSPNGLKIAYDGSGGTPGPRIRVMDADPATADWTVISDPCEPGPDCYGDFQPAWSPDGTRIAFVSSGRTTRDGTPTYYQLFVMDALGEVGPLADATRLTADVPNRWGKSIENSQATWSPDGQWIAFLSTGRGTHEDACDIWKMRPWDRDGDGYGDGLTRLTFDESFNCDPFEDVNPQWSPNSDLIAFTSTRFGNFDIWLVNADDPSDLRNVTQTPNDNEDQPSWSPDGTQVVFRSSTSGASELYSLPVPPPAPSAMTSLASADQAPLSRDRGTVTGVRTAAMTSTTPPTRKQLTFDGLNKQQSDWGQRRGVTPGTRTLTVSNTGRGWIRSKPAGLLCGTDCAATFVVGREVQLTAVTRAPYTFRAWGGACAGTTGPTCIVTLDRSRKAWAEFVK